jgi:hypothetical protein
MCSQQNNVHAARLELIIIWLLIVDCVLMLFQVGMRQGAGGRIRLSGYCGGLLTVCHTAGRFNADALTR